VLTVECSTIDGKLLLSEESTDLSTDPNAVIDPALVLPSSWEKRQIKISTPNAGATWTPPYDANGPLDQGTQFSQCYFKCGTKKTFDNNNTSTSSTTWMVKFPNLAPCPNGGGTLTVVGDDTTSDSHGNITVN
jgi:hypothetical protein